ncbi:3-dehydroquinate synthase [Deinococcus yavapaiensis KR-236]|uniref:3-dehydroquinate synthase n=2 Tax=Deinococcus TaxID=1298 RepID=A0A318SC34_9DEIO|nr:3-dehydroquinate synthase [Deinococcus yavapaiensis KR-236]
MRIDVGGAAPYAVSVRSGALQDVAVSERRRALLFDEGVPRPFVDEVRSRLQPEVEVALPRGEACKTLTVFAEVLSTLARAALPRDAAVIGLGGGAATDLAGFVASAYLRGVAFYTLPTTLLGQVDAAVGGKTGVNLPEGKNLVGAFWPPKGVWCDTATLAALPSATFREGAAEVFKHGLIADPVLCDDVVSGGFGPHAAHLEEIVGRAVKVKADVVTRDLTERGERAHLNFGHTLAHALEAVTGHALPHGEAVGYGLHFAALLSRRLGGEDVSKLTERFLAYQRPRSLPDFAWQDVAPFVARDKKADSRGVRFVLLEKLARPYVAHVDEADVRVAFDEWHAFVRGMVK